MNKNNYLNLLSCHKKYWLMKNQKETLTIEDENYFIMQYQYKQMFNSYKKLFVDAKEIDISNLEIAELETKELLKQGHNTIFNAVFKEKESNDFVVVDCLFNNGKTLEISQIHLAKSIELRIFLDSAGSYDEDLLQELAFLNRTVDQFIADNSELGLSHSTTHIITLNSNYTREGELDLLKLFVKYSMDSVIKTDEMKKKIDNDINEIIKVDQHHSAPHVMIGNFCKKPYDCPFRSQCWKNVESNSIHFLPRITEKKRTDLLSAGFETVEQITDFSLLTDNQKTLVKNIQLNKIVKNPMKMMMFFNRMQYPLYFLDFEAMIPSVPLYDKTKPFDIIPTQYSLHIQDRNNVLTHTEYIHKMPTDPRLQIALNLIEDLGDKGSIIVYNKTFESSVITNLTNLFPDLAVDLAKLQNRLVDLMAPFKDGDYFHPKMYFSYSLKAVLPALVPELSYKSLDIQNGAQAMQVYFDLLEEKDSNKKQIMLKNLAEYCKMDTLAMVKILEVIKK